MRQRVIHTLSVTLLCLMLFANMLGCAKKVALSSGETSSTTKGKSAAPVETIQPESMTTIPDDRRSTMETARPPLDIPPSDTPSPRNPASLASSLGDIFFDFDQYTIRGDARSVLEADAMWIKSAVGKSILIEGHCDERGTQAYNLVLGEKRARSTKRYLEDLGVASSRLKIVSFGEIRPFCKEHDETCYQKNRRAHFVAQ